MSDVPAVPRVVPFAPPAAPTYALYDAPAVGIASLLGSPLAGAIVLAINYKRLNRAGAGWLTILVGTAVTAALVAIGMMLPGGVGGAIGIAHYFLGVGASRALQESDLTAHKQLGGAMSSNWRAAGIGLITGLCVAVVIVGGLFGYFSLTAPLPGTRITIGQNDEIYFSGTATETNARDLGKALQDAGLLRDRGVTVQLIKRNGTTVIGYIVTDDGWNKPMLVDVFELFTRRAAPAVGGLPIEVRLMDEQCEVKKTWTVN